MRPSHQGPCPETVRVGAHHVAQPGTEPAWPRSPPSRERRLAQRSHGSRAARAHALAIRRWRGGRAHPPLPLRRQRRDLRPNGAGVVEQLLRPVGAKSLLQRREVLAGGPHLGEWHPVRAERAFGWKAVDLLETGPSLRRAQHDHWPPWPAARHSRGSTPGVIARLGPVHGLVNRGCGSQGVSHGDLLFCPPTTLPTTAIWRIRCAPRHLATDYR